MTKFIKVVMVFISLIVLCGFGFSQVELHVFGQYNINLTYPGDVTTHFNLSALVDPLEAFHGPSIEQKNGIGLGGRIAFNISPNFAIEGTIEYIMAKTQFLDQIQTDINNYYPAPLPTGQTMSILDGGSIMRYYGNVVFNIPSSATITPYITAGVGITKFTLKKGSGPEFHLQWDWTPSIILGLYDFYYEDVSVLTFNGGLGIKFKISPNFGIRIDGRVFYSSPEINQYMNWTFLTVKLYENENSLTQTGAHIDTSLNFGIFIAL